MFISLERLTIIKGKKLTVEPNETNRRFIRSTFFRESTWLTSIVVLLKKTKGSWGIAIYGSDPKPYYSIEKRGSPIYVLL